MTDNYVLNKTADESSDALRDDEIECDPLDLVGRDGVSGHFQYKNSELR
jgi:hypothetical protein